MSASPRESVTLQSTVEAMHELPDCFYTYSHEVSGVYFDRLVIRGNSTFADPLYRVLISTKMKRSTPSFIATRSFFVQASGELATPDWSSAFTLVPSFGSFQMIDCKFAPGATIPSILPFSSTVSFSGCYLGGSLSSTLMNAYVNMVPGTQVSINLAMNAITGIIPADLFSHWDPSTVLYFSFDLGGNKISGQLPANLFSKPMSTVKQFRFLVNINLLTGTIPPLLTPSTLVDGTLTTYSVVYDNNNFTGSIPSLAVDIGGKTSKLVTLAFTAKSTLLTGTIPSNFISSIASPTLSSVNVQFTQSKLTGGLPSGLLNIGSATATDWTIDFSENALNGTIASDLFAPINWSKMRAATFYFQGNQLTGDLPSVLMTDSNAPKLATMQLFFSENPRLTGSIPSTFLGSMQPVAPADSVAVTAINLALSYTGLTGAFVVPDWSTRLPVVSLVVSASNTNFTSISIPSGSANNMLALQFPDNNHLEGTIPSGLFSSTLLQSFNFQYSRLGGDFPLMTSSSLPKISNFVLTGTNVDFCSGTRETWTLSTLTSCILTSTNAQECSSLYPNCSTSAVVPWSAPIVAPPPEPLSSPVSEPLPVPIGCSESTRPSPQFICVGSVWVFQGEYTAPVLVIPGGATETVVSGNVSSSSVVIGGLGSTLTIQGCADNLTIVTIQLTAEEVKKLGSTTIQQLISLDSHANCSSLAGVEVVSKVSGSTCKKLKVTKVADEQSFSAVFTLDNSGCRTWWIVLAAVLGSCVLLAIIFVLLVVFVAPVRHCVRPYSKRAAVDAESSLPKR